MTILELPVSSFSKKILLSEYGPEPLIFSSNDPTYQSLCYRAPKYRHNLEKLKWYLNDVIRIQINNKLARHIKENACQIGHHLWTLHIHQMIGWTNTSVMLNEPAKTSIERFYDYYGINEDDFSLESAYKRWQRWKRKKNVKIGRERFNKKAVLVLPNCPILKVVVPPTNTDIDQFIALLVIDNEWLFHRQDGAFCNPLFLQLRAYSYNRIGQISVKDLVKDWKWKKRTTYKRIARFQERLKNEQELAHVFRTYAEEHFGVIV